MSIVRITSWNAQGNGIDKISQSYSNILPNGKDNILLLQEAGSTYGGGNLEGEVNQTFGRTKYKGVFKQHEDADNKRCTTGIMASCDSIRKYYMTIDYVDLDGVNRPVMIATAQFKNFNLYIATVHATAYYKVSKDEIVCIDAMLEGNAKELEWQYILMGDLNIPPDVLRSYYPNLQNKIISTGKATLKNGNELDYAIASPQLVGKPIKIIHGDDYGSDHYPIYIEFDSDMSLKS